MAVIIEINKPGPTLRGEPEECGICGRPSRLLAVNVLGRLMFVACPVCLDAITTAYEEEARGIDHTSGVMKPFEQGTHKAG
jgi:hypothetical protein